MVRPQQPRRRGAGAPSAAAEAHGPDDGPPDTPGDGVCARGVRGAGRGARSLRLRVAGDAARGRAARAHDLRRRVRVPRRRLRARRDRAVAPVHPRPRGRPALRRHALAGTLRGQARPDRRQAKLGLRDRARAPPVGAGAHARLASPGGDGRPRVLAGSSALPPAVRGARARRGRHVRPRRRARAGRADERRLPGAGERDGPAREARARGRRARARDGLPDAASRPAPSRGRHRRRGTAAGADAVLGERLRAGDLLRRQRHPGLTGTAEVRRDIELELRERLSLQRARPRPPDRGAALRDRARAAATSA